MISESTTFEMFQEKHRRWREYGGLRKYTVQQMDRIFGDMMRTQIRACNNPAVSDRHKKMMIEMWPAICLEHEMRQKHRLFISFEMEDLECQ